MTIFNAIIERMFYSQVQDQIREQMAVIERENTFLIGTRSQSESKRDRLTYNREDILQKSLDAWRINPLARRIVELTSQYVVGRGIALNCKHHPTNNFINSFWHHRLNHMPIRIFSMCDELTRTGNLFILITTDSAGMSYIRTIPAFSIEKIESRANDIEQPIAFYPKSTLEEIDPSPWLAYDPQETDISQPVMLQYTINRPAGAQWGESDLAPLLRWLSRYSSWLEDRARLNRYRNAFLYVVSAKFNSEAQRKARQTALNAHPPKPGSILVTDENEAWKVINPRLQSAEAKEDGLALKKMISAGAGLPMHFLAEPEGSTRTTAEAAGGPTYRRFEQRQKFFLWIIHDILQIAVNRRAILDRKINPSAEIEVNGADISARDNINLAMAAGNILAVLSDLRDRNLIDNSEFLRLIYRFTGETVDIEDMLARAKKTAKDKQGTLPPIPPAKSRPQNLN